MRLASALLVLAAGCGRFAFDPLPGTGGDGGPGGDGSDGSTAMCTTFGPWDPPTQITSANASTIYDDWQPVIHPSGLLIVFESNRPAGSTLYAITRPTKTDPWGPARQLTELYGGTMMDGGVSPMFSPDGSQLYYLQYIGAGGSGPFVAPYLGGDMFGANVPADLPATEVEWSISADALELFWTDENGADPDLNHARRTNTSMPWVADTEIDALNQAGLSQGWPSFDEERQELYYEAESGNGTFIAVTQRATPTSAFGAPTFLMALGSAGDPDISTDGTILVFASDRVGANNNDMFFTTRQCQ